MPEEDMIVDVFFIQKIMDECHLFQIIYMIELRLIDSL